MLHATISVSKTITQSENQYNHNLPTTENKINQNFNTLVAEQDWENSSLFQELIKANLDNAKNYLRLLEEYYTSFTKFDNLNFNRAQAIPRNEGELFFTQETFSDFYILLYSLRESVIYKLRCLIEAALICKENPEWYKNTMNDGQNMESKNKEKRNEYEKIKIQIRDKIHGNRFLDRLQPNSIIPTLLTCISSHMISEYKKRDKNISNSVEYLLDIRWTEDKYTLRKWRNKVRVMTIF